MITQHLGDTRPDDVWAAMRDTWAARSRLKLAAGVELRGVRDRREQTRVTGRRRAIEHPQPRPAEVLGDHRLAVAPGDAGAQVERVDEPVLRDVPAVGLTGHRLERARILAGEPLEHETHDAAVGLSAGEPGVERLGLGAEVERERVVRGGRHVAEPRDGGGVARGARGRAGEDERARHDEGEREARGEKACGHGRAE